MIRCTFCLNGNQLSNLSCPGIGFFPACSGSGTSRNDPDAVAVPSIGPLPTGLYYIVTRGTGGVVTMVSDSLASFISGSDRSIWFALYRHDSQIDDHTLLVMFEEETSDFILPVIKV